MSGYAFYVWGSYIVSFVALGTEVVVLLRRHKSLAKQSPLSGNAFRN
jgi:heme exporter protein CcmD